MSTEPHSVSDVLDGLDSLAESKSHVSVGDMLDEFGNRSFAPVMLVLALLDLSPIGGIPGVPTFLAACIALIALQLLFARNHIWIPAWIRGQSVKGRKLVKATNKLSPLAEKLDVTSQDRLEAVTHGIGLRVAAALIVLLCVTIPPLEFLPFASVVPMAAIAVLSLAIMTRDGVALILAGLFSSGALVLGTYYYWTTDVSEVASEMGEEISAEMDEASSAVSESIGEVMQAN